MPATREEESVTAKKQPTLTNLGGFSHGKVRHLHLLENIQFCKLHIAQPNVDYVMGIQARFKVAKEMSARCLNVFEKEGYGHAMQVARLGRVFGVDIGVGVDPNLQERQVQVST